MEDFIYNGKSLNSLGFLIKGSPTYVYPERDIEFFEIMGGEGSELLDNKGFKNMVITYNINSFPYWVQDKTDDQLSKMLADWLYSEYNDYKILRDTLHPGRFCYAVPQKPNDVLNPFHGLLDTSVVFTARPYWYTDVGTQPVVVEPDEQVSSLEIKLHNPEKITAAPIIKVKAINSASGKTITVTAGKTVSVIDNNNVVIDCLNEIVYRGTDNANLSDKSSNDYFPYLTPGDNVISITAEDNIIDRVTVIPNWRRIS